MTDLIKVDPKAWFTNERTFLHWLNMSMIISAASIAAVSSIGYAVSLISFAIIGVACYKYARRYRELTLGVVDEGSSDFLDIKTPIFIACIFTFGICVAIVVAINEWEVSRYS